MASGPGGAAPFGLRVADLALIIAYGGLLLIAGLFLLSAIRLFLRDIRSNSRQTGDNGAVGKQRAPMAMIRAAARQSSSSGGAVLRRTIKSLQPVRSAVNWPNFRAASYGEIVDDLSIQGRQIRAGVFNENEVRAAAGITLALGAFGFVNAFYGQSLVPLRFVTAFMVTEFLLRVSLGLRFSPAGWVARQLTRSVPPIWVSARPKRFAWMLGLALSLVLATLQIAGIRGTVPLIICSVCLSLMWLEAVLGICLGCEIYGWLVRNKWVSANEEYEVCSRSACEVVSAKATGSEL
ncbi:hypothetical protein N185_15750 [Sinorhizobium sp. GW3]|nr:hypothetical protein N185_15750 [Sinorhizobium sp. GW3]